MMLVNSKQLTDAAATVRKRKRPQMIHAEGVVVTARQCETAARLLREAEPSICNGDVQERPGFIDRDQQSDPNVLAFTVGIIPRTRYRIARNGELLDGEDERGRDAG